MLRVPMRVAFFIDNLGSGGAQRQAVEIAVRLRQERVHVAFALYRRIDFFAPRLERAGIHVERLPKHGPLDAAFPGRIRAWVAAERPDVLHAFLPAPALWAALAIGRSGPPPVGGPVWIAGERSSPRENLGPLWRRLQRWAYRRYDAVTANSRSAAEYLTAHFGVPAGRVHYLPNGIDLEEWDRRAAAPPPQVFEPDRLHLALVGRMTEEKNHRLLLEALSRLGPGPRRGLRVWFVGAMDQAPHLVARIRREIEARGLGEVVRLVPATSELPAFMAALDAVVLPSRYEGFPNVVLEAMASRLPVVASAVGDVPSMLEDGESGFVVPAGDAPALAAGLTRLLGMTAGERAAMGAAARRTVESRFGIGLVARKHLELYGRLADARCGDAAARGLG